jgi:acyl-CoA synthetase (AMP-forming)/AMP-acid ligase II
MRCDREERFMHGLMQEWPLLCHKVLDHAAKHHAAREIVSRSVEGPIVRTNYAEIRRRALKAAQLLAREGYQPGDRIATLAWNTARHIEAWYGIMGMGGVYHTLNPRLFPEQIAWIMNHAEDRLLFVDLTFMPLVEKIAPVVPSLKKVVVLTDKAHLPETALPNVVAYEDWIAGADGDYEWLALDEAAGGGHVLHVRHDRRPQGRRLFASLERAARNDRLYAGRHGHFIARRDHAGGADVPRQRMGTRSKRADDRRQIGHAGREDGRRVDL